MGLTAPEFTRKNFSGNVCFVSNEREKKSHFAQESLQVYSLVYLEQKNQTVETTFTFVTVVSVLVFL